MSNETSVRFSDRFSRLKRREAPGLGGQMTEEWWYCVQKQI